MGYSQGLRGGKERYMRKRLIAALAVVAALTLAGIAIAGSLPGSGTGRQR